MSSSLPLRQWLTTTADRDHTTIQAAALIVCEGALGDLPQRLGPVIEVDPDTERAWIAWPAALILSAAFSSGERRLIALAASLASGHPVDLADALTGLDPHNAELVAEALAHALGVDLAHLTQGDH